MSAKPAPLHLIVDGIAPPLPPDTAPPPLPELARLRAFIARMQIDEVITADEASLATPFELALARAHGLPHQSGLVPWAAFETSTLGTPCAWLSPCHWQVSLDQVSLLDPGELALSEGESRALMGAIEPLLAEDGIQLRYVRPEAWLAQGALLQGVATASMARARGTPLTPETLMQARDPTQGVRLRRLQSEIEMLLHQHPVNDAREADGRWSVNAVWFSGAGQLDAPVHTNPTVVTETRLRELSGNAGITALANAWQTIEADAAPRLAAALAAGAELRLTLCGPRQAFTLVPAHGLRARLARKMRPLKLDELRARS